MLSTPGWNLHLVAHAASGTQSKEINVLRNAMANRLEKRQYESAGEKRLAAAFGNSFQSVKTRVTDFFR